MRQTPAFRRLPRAVREQQILDAALVTFSRVGFHAASVDEIAAAAGVSKPMVYAYIGAKEELFVACLHRAGVNLIEAIAAAAVDGVGTEEQLWLGIRAFFGFVAAHRDGWSVLYRQARGQQPFAPVLDQLRERIAEIIAQILIRKAAKAGVPLPAEEASATAYAFAGAAEALADWAVDHPNTAPEVSATRLMNLVWLGSAALIRGQTWSPPGAQGAHGTDQPGAGSSAATDVRAGELGTRQ